MPRKTTKKSAPRVIVGLAIFAIIVAAAFFRFYNIDKMVYWHDEAHTSIWMSGYTWPEVKRALDGRQVRVEDVLKYQRTGSEKNTADTVRALADYDPQHPPLYYASARLWAYLFGDSIASLRSFSALVGMVILALVYWLAMELFGSRRVACCAVVLIAVSPFHVLYAKEARQYIMLLALTLLASAVLLRALRRNTKKLWVAYALSTAFGLYTHLFFANVVAAHWMYIFAMQLSRQPGGGASFIRGLIPFGASSLAGVIAFTPWAWVIFAKTSQVSALTSWLDKPIPLLRLIGMWGYNYSVIFLDVDTAWGVTQQIDAGVAASYLFQCLILILEGYALYFLFRKAPRHCFLFIFLLIAVPFLILAIPDLLWGRGGSWVCRYLSPSFLGIYLAVAYLLATGMESGSRKLWQSVSVLLVLGGILSCVLILRADSWWYKGKDYYTTWAAEKVNAAAQPLLITHFSGFLFPICHKLDPGVRIVTAVEGQDIDIPEGGGEVFVYRPAHWLKQTLRGKYGGRFVRIDPHADLWRLEGT